MFACFFACMCQESLEKQIHELDVGCSHRRKNLEASKSFHEFMRESRDLEHWIDDQQQIANSEEYGKDYEHLQASDTLVRKIYCSQ